MKSVISAGSISACGLQDLCAQKRRFQSALFFSRRYQGKNWFKVGVSPPCTWLRCRRATGGTNESISNMGMDVYGRKPTAKVGEYFRNNVWWWRPLAHLCNELAPDICAKCTYWQSNDGDGLDEEGALALAAVLECALADGTIDKFVKENDEYLASLPDEPCKLCDGTGVRTDELAKSAGMVDEVINEPGHPRHGQKGTCNACGGRGHVPPWQTHYCIDAENVREFAAFLGACGGFNIH